MGFSPQLWLVGSTPTAVPTFGFYFFPSGPGQWSVCWLNPCQHEAPVGVYGSHWLYLPPIYTCPLLAQWTGILFWWKIRIFSALHMLYYTCHWNSMTLLLFLHRPGRRASPPGRTSVHGSDKRSVFKLLVAFWVTSSSKPNLSFSFYELCINACLWQHPSEWCRVSAPWLVGSTPTAVLYYLHLM